MAEIKLKAERAYLRKLKGGCSIPAFANAQIIDNVLILQAGIFSLNGNEFVRKSVEGSLDDPEALGLQLGIDVLSEEPPINGNVLLDKNIPNLILTPHIAWATVEAQQRLIDKAVENIISFLQGDAINIVS